MRKSQFNYIVVIFILSLVVTLVFPDLLLSEIPAVKGKQPYPVEMSVVFEKAGANRLGLQAPKYPNIHSGLDGNLVNATVPSVLLKAVAYTESKWKQYEKNYYLTEGYGLEGQTLIAGDGGYGIMQITTPMKDQNEAKRLNIDQNKVAGDYIYNIGSGAVVLISKWNAIVQAIGENDPKVIEDWYFAIWAYNSGEGSIKKDWLNDPVSGGNCEKLLEWECNPNNCNYNPNRPTFDGTQPRACYPYQEIVWGYAANANPKEDQWNQTEKKRFWEPVKLTLPNRSEIGNMLESGGKWISRPEPYHIDDNPLLKISEVNIIPSIASIDFSNFPDIKLYTTVENVGGEPIFDLASSHFRVYEDQVREDIRVSSVGAGIVGTSVCVIMDTSGSMVYAINDAQTAAISFVNNLKTQDKAALIRFTEFVTIVQPFTDNKDALIRAISDLYGNGNTAFYDAVFKGVAMSSTQPGIKAIIALTDGMDNSSAKTAKEIIDYAKSVSVPIYIVGLAGEGGLDERTLSLIANETGGKYYQTPKSEELLKLYRDISDKLKNLYEVSYTTHNPNRDSTPRTVTVQVFDNEAPTKPDSIQYTAPGVVGTISGIVSDSKTNTPIKSASILIEHDTGYLKVIDASVSTNDKGEYQVGNLSPDYQYKVTASGMKYYKTTYPNPVTVKALKTTEKIDFELQPIDDYFDGKRTKIQELRDNEAVYEEEENKAEELLDDLENKGASLTKQEKESIQRLYLSEDFSSEAYSDSKRLAQLATNGLGGFFDIAMASITACGGVSEALKNIPFVGEFLASPYIAAKDEMANQIAIKSHMFLYQNYNVPWTLKGDKLLRDAIAEGYDEIFLKASNELANRSFSDAMAEVHKFIEKRFFLGIYELCTAGFMDESVEWAQSSPSVFRVGSFSNAEYSVNKLLNSMNLENEDKIKRAELLVWAGDTIGTAGAVASGITIAGAVVLSALSAKTIVGAPLAAVLLPLSAKIAVATGAASGGLKIGTTTGIAIDLWSTIPNYVKNGTAYSFDSPPSVWAAPSVATTPYVKYMQDDFGGSRAPSRRNSVSTTYTSSDYDLFLSEIRGYIQNDESEKVKEIMNNLIGSGKALQGDTNISMAQILVASPIALQEIADYDAIYSKIETDLFQATSERISLYTLLGSYLANPADPSIKELLALQIDKTIGTNNELENSFASTTQALNEANITIPNLVVFKGFSTPSAAPLGKPFTISTTVINIGNKDVSDVNIVLSIPDGSGLVLMEEGIKNLGGLVAGEEKEISWELQYINWYSPKESSVIFAKASVSSDSDFLDFDTLPPTYVLVPAPPRTPPTGGKLSNKNIYAYPNPFNPDVGVVNIRYSLNKNANVTIEIYDVGSELVTTLIKDQPREKELEYSESWDGRNDQGNIVANGVYFYLITTTKGEKAVGKIAVLR